ncbi:MAG: magnesium transporter [Phycisphaerae bacterium]|nr:magnesium transporter [Phycisphaerae bacterium]
MTIDRPQPDDASDSTPREDEIVVHQPGIETPEEQAVDELLETLPHATEEQVEELAPAMEDLPPADAADTLESLEPQQSAEVLTQMEEESAAEALAHMDSALAATVLLDLEPEEAASFIDEMEPDDAADILQALPKDACATILKGLPLRKAALLGKLALYDPRSAGGVMTTDILVVRAGMTIGQAIEFIRTHPMNETQSDVYAVDDERRLVGAITLRQLLFTDDRELVSAHVTTDLDAVLPTVDREEVARLFQKYDYITLPVVDEARRILGMVTVDDVIDVAQQEATEAIQKIGGMEALDAPYTQVGFVKMVRKRGGWLAVLFLGETLTATAMGHFEHEIERAAVVALFVPLIISSGGNSGSQATTIIIRSLALRELSLRDWRRVISREFLTGTTLGAFLGFIGFVRIILWYHLGWHHYEGHPYLIASTVWLSLIGVVMFGSVVGSMLPFILRGFRFDPASASAPFVATLVDVTGLVIYFSIAILVLKGTLL